MKKLLYILILLFGSISLSAQEIEVSAKMSNPSILIGEEIKIDLAVSYRVDNGEVSILFPQFNDTIIDKIEVLSSSKIDTLIPNKEDAFLFEQKQQIAITSYDSGYYQIPPFIFIVNNDTFKTEPLLIDVQNMEVDTAAATIKDIKTPLEEPFSVLDWLKENWAWVAGTLALIILIILFIIYLSKKKPAEVTKVAEPIILPHITAIERLERLQQEKLWQDGKVKQYHSEISEIIREYIEKRYQVNALEETTSEIIHGLRLHRIDSLIMTKLNQTLVLADLVKFAKEKPIASENEMSINNALKFVNSTKLIEKSQENTPIIPSRG